MYLEKGGLLEYFPSRQMQKLFCFLPVRLQRCSSKAVRHGWSVERVEPLVFLMFQTWKWEACNDARSARAVGGKSKKQRSNERNIKHSYIFKGPTVEQNPILEMRW